MKPSQLTLYLCLERQVPTGYKRIKRAIKLDLLDDTILPRSQEIDRLLDSMRIQLDLLEDSAIVRK